jgi:hypothetical protein
MDLRGKDTGVVTIIALLAALLSGCGSPAAPGSWGTDETNTVVSSEVMLEAVDLCDPSGSQGSADIQTETINENLPENTLYLEGYEVDFTPETSGAPPIEGLSASESRALPVAGLKLLFIDPGRMAKYLEDIAGGGYSPEGAVYTVEYIFHGKDLHGSDFGTVARSTFSIPGYAGCEALSISPESVKVTGVPDSEELSANDPSDDLIFSVRGGLAPYAIESSNGVVSQYPDSMAEAGTFTVEPDAAASEATVTITVTDSAGASVTAMLTLGHPEAPGTLSVSPGAVSLTGVANPDGDASDDIVFHISGGTGPYIVYSDSAAVIPAPSVNPDGTFTVDPDSVSGTEVVTLTVVDSVGAARAAEITVKAEAVPKLLEAPDSLSVIPEKISVTGIANPDGDASDDIVFHISGGTGPYTVYSDSAAVIPAPSVNPDGTFTVDPDSVPSETTVTLTVVDSTGESSTVAVTVTP